MMLGEG